MHGRVGHRADTGLQGGTVGHAFSDQRTDPRRLFVDNRRGGVRERLVSLDNDVNQVQVELGIAVGPRQVLVHLGDHQAVAVARSLDRSWQDVDLGPE